MHYQRNRRYGDPNITLIVQPPKGELLEYFYKAIKLETDDCVEWPYSINKNGYGKVKYKGKRTYVHRLALMLVVGEGPEDKPLALHKPAICHNPNCFNPRHLYWGSYKDNNADTILDGTSTRGERSGASKLTEAQVLEIRTDTRVHRVIAEQYGVSDRTVSFIKNRKIWNHI